MNKRSFDVIVIGAGHAGSEAALASSRMGCLTLLVTMRKDSIALLSCNPAIGGVGKAQLVKEVDAIGGEMAKATDASGIQFKMLNASKGAAVHSSRAQVGRNQYAAYMKYVVEHQKNLHIRETEIKSLIMEDDTVKGVITEADVHILGSAVIVSPGTFLNGLMHIGMKHFSGGRIEEKKASLGLSESLKMAGFNLMRFKTGTCARLDGKTIDFSKLKAQLGDEPPRPFSFSTDRLNVKQVPCYITYTTEATHEIIRKNLKRSPLFSGKIKGTPVRYCPSLEDKIIKFPHHPRHQIFLEPDGIDTDEYYPNGLSTSLPEDVQEEFIHSVTGLEDAKINRFGYGIEHDVIDSTGLFPTMESKAIRGLYTAGQVNGTTGYEEAAAQGLIAGINAALNCKGKKPLIFDRASSYIGVLIDDLVTKGTNEPYRMFTSRVEYRLMIREDNADMRLSKIGFNLGLVSEETYDKVKEKERLIKEGLKYLKANTISKDGKKIALYQYLKRPHTEINDVRKGLPPEWPESVLRGLEIEIKYAGFIKREASGIKSFKHLEKIKIPPWVNYSDVPSISGEIKEKLDHFRPLNLGQASRISGVTPVAISVLMVYLKKVKNQN